MPFKLKQLLLFFLLFNLIWSISMGANSGGIVAYFSNFFETSKSVSLKITTTISFFLYALSAYFFLWYFSKRKNILAGFILLALFIPLVMLCRYFLEEIFSPAFFGFRNYNPDYTIPNYFRDNKYFAIPNTAFGIVFYFLQSNQYKENEKRDLQNQNRQAELDFLKNQINPHFLFNNLNNIYSLIYHKSDNALMATEQLSSLLRYMLYNKNEKVLLKEEVAYLLNFIELQKLRFDYDLPLIVNDNTADSNLQIAPLLLIPLVENAFKHGDFKQEDFPLIIDLQAMHNELSFKVENKKGKYEKDATHGIGIGNLKRRLELIYPGSYLFEVEESETYYKTILKINL